MELRQYIDIIKKNILIITLVTLLGAAVAFYFSLNFQSGYKFEQDFFLLSQGTLADTLQNSYYSAEKAINFTDTAVAILQSPDFANDLDIKGSVATRKLAPRVIQITTITPDRQSAKTLMGQVVSSFNAKIGKLEPSSTFQINTIGKVPDSKPAGPSPKIVVVFGAAFGFVVSLVAIGLKTYFRL